MIFESLPCVSGRKFTSKLARLAVSERLFCYFDHYTCFGLHSRILVIREAARQQAKSKIGRRLTQGKPLADLPISVHGFQP